MRNLNPPSSVWRQLHFRDFVKPQIETVFVILSGNSAKSFLLSAWNQLKFASFLGLTPKFSRAFSGETFCKCQNWNLELHQINFSLTCPKQAFLNWTKASASCFVWWKTLCDGNGQRDHSKWFCCVHWAPWEFGFWKWLCAFWQQKHIKWVLPTFVLE